MKTSYINTISSYGYIVKHFDASKIYLTWTQEVDFNEIVWC